jgi:Ca2+-dependent lipid-binding protein
MLITLMFWPTNLNEKSSAMKRPVGILKVKVLRAMKLKKKDLMGASDPYVKIKLTEDKLPAKKTTVKHKNLNPEWNEEFNLVVKDPESQALELRVYDWEQVKNLHLLLRSFLFSVLYFKLLYSLSLGWQT